MLCAQTRVRDRTRGHLSRLVVEDNNAAADGYSGLEESARTGIGYIQVRVTLSFLLSRWLQYGLRYLKSELG